MAADIKSRLDTIVKAYDIRGLVPDELDADVARRLGSAVAQFLLAEDASVQQLLIGRDMRPTGPELTAAFTEGVTGHGLAVVDLGLISTDMLYFGSGVLDAPGAVFTASHNPAGYNGIKLCRRGAAPIGQDSGLADIKALAIIGDLGSKSAPVSSRDLLDAFAEHVLSFVDAKAIRPLKIVVDTANGMGGHVVPAVLSRLPVVVDYLYLELDGTFPNHPADPIQPENLVDLQARVRELGADIGLAFDGDADRVFIIDELAQPVSGSLTTSMVAAAMLEKEPGGLILYNLICSKAVPEIVRENGGSVERTRVGHSFIKERMKETGAIFAGEHSGHYYFRDNYRADSGLITSVVVLEMLSHSADPLSVMRQPFERYAASGEINTRVKDQQAVLAAVAAAFPDATVDHLDGMTVDLGDWWFNLRPSNTEPLLRLNLEAPTDADVELRVTQVRAVMDAA